MFVLSIHDHDSFSVAFQVLCSQNDEGAVFVVDFLFFQIQITERASCSRQLIYSSGSIESI